MSPHSLLVELLVEELPPKSLLLLSRSFAQTLSDQLKTQGLLTPLSHTQSFGTPRRLGVYITPVLAQAFPRTIEQKLMPATVGFLEGKPTAALLKKLAHLGLDEQVIPQIRQVNEGKAEQLYLSYTVDGVKLAMGLQLALDAALAALPIAKTMQYQLSDGWQTVQFVRPAHGLVALHGSDVVPVQCLGLSAGRTTQGHRFQAQQPLLTLPEADAYEELLIQEGHVMPSLTQRRAQIEQGLQAAAQQVRWRDALRPMADPDLLDEVTALVEWPQVFCGQFEEAFLTVPQECLVLTMKANQKYFPLVNEQGQLSPYFLIVSNSEPADPRRIIEGNERVIRPRLADAQFFFQQDCKKTLESRLPGLAKVVYHAKLGTQAERVKRVRGIAQAIAKDIAKDIAQSWVQCEGDHLPGDFVEQVDQAARLAKADLLTDMVGEFPELQGTMGRYYALQEGLLASVADAIEDHYKPRFSGDALPRGPVGLVVALADKLETLMGLFGIGQLPTGEKDPFALRRHALGVLRLLIEKQLPLNLDELLTLAAGIVKGDVAHLPMEEVCTQLKRFMVERLTGFLREAGHRPQAIEAVLAVWPQPLCRIGAHLEAVQAFAELPESTALAAANKRIGQILKKDGGQVDPHVNPALFQAEAEEVLWQVLQATEAIALPQFEAGQYMASLKTLAALRPAVDAFFEQVLVNAQEAAVRLNRLGLLQTLHQTMNRVADLSRLA
jgi:glycyl-tRNA synthetase beta chain